MLLLGIAMSASKQDTENGSLPSEKKERHAGTKLLALAHTVIAKEPRDRKSIMVHTTSSAALVLLCSFLPTRGVVGFLLQTQNTAYPDPKRKTTKTAILVLMGKNFLLAHHNNHRFCDCRGTPNLWDIGVVVVDVDTAILHKIVVVPMIVLR
mmetsp:Transcript_7086/g.14487  ORF Transcript_7086/g.14487 Transcript_7086/m.14487 type:complete len:152 (+) Transcript_7086:323-778(+)